MIAEHITTIEKSMNQIATLSGETPLNHNQITRWVQNKENHAGELQRIATQYFMTQRVKPVDKEDTEAHAAYTKKLTLLHQMVVYAMKAKQTTDPANVEKLRSLLAEFKKEYFGESNN
jgi:nickel superoxide dismutase